MSGQKLYDIYGGKTVTIIMDFFVAMEVDDGVANVPMTVDGVLMDYDESFLHLGDGNEVNCSAPVNKILQIRFGEEEEMFIDMMDESGEVH